ncbi:MAG: hypothetical protein ACFFHV_20310 [Promethearchaeota archaeon]
MKRKISIILQVLGILIVISGFILTLSSYDWSDIVENVYTSNELVWALGFIIGLGGFFLNGFAYYMMDKSKRKKKELDSL